jgi:RNA-directed DNA polymerase
MSREVHVRFCERREVRLLPATHLVALCHSRQQALEAKMRLAAWLAPRGLAFNEDKTRVVTLEEGFDFLGFNVRRYRGKLLIKPSKQAVRRTGNDSETSCAPCAGATLSR